MTDNSDKCTWGFMDDDDNDDDDYYYLWNGYSNSNLPMSESKRFGIGESISLISFIWGSISSGDISMGVLWEVPWKKSIFLVLSDQLKRMSYF